MKKEYKEIIKKAINDSELNGYKWTIKSNKLIWSYLDVEFDIEIKKEENVKIIHDGETFIYILVGNEFYNDAKTIEDGLYKAIKGTIRKANNLF